MSNRVKVPAFGVFVAVIVAIVGLLIPRPEPVPVLAGTVLNAKAAPLFTLRDENGRQISLQHLRGRVVLVTFLESHCKELCPLIAESLRRTADQLQGRRSRVAFLVISTAPEQDTGASVKAFSRNHHMLGRWHYLNAKRSMLRSVWSAYYVYAAPRSAPGKLRDMHTSVTYLIDPQGRKRVLITGNPSSTTLVRDIRILAGLPSQGAASSRVPAPEVGHIAPSFTLRSAGVGRGGLGSFRNRVVLVNFWATWCHPCRSEMPRLQRWYRRYRSRGLTVLGVDQEEARQDVNVFARQMGVTYDTLLDSNGDVSAQYGVAGLPTSFLIDRQGYVRAVKVGILREEFLSRQLLPVLREGR